MRFLGALLVSLSLLAAPSHAQEAPAGAPAASVQAAGEHAAAVTSAESRGVAPEGAARSDADIITPHITDSHFVDYPCFSMAHGLVCEKELPRWAPIQVGSLAIDMSPTKHVVFMLLAATVCLIVLLTGTAAHKRHSHAVGRPKGFASGIEATILYMRNEVVLKNVGPNGQRYVPFVLSLFFFILFANLFGLIPYGSTATGNISVTATLAIITFVVVEIAGMRALGAGYIGTIVYWPHDMPLAVKLPMTFIMTPVEIVGKITKPFALAIRLFANMTAGHVVLLALIGLIFTFGSWALVLPPILMSVAISMLELFVAFLQAFIFSLLASVFIGQIRTAHH
jgi:F-type H+-transporting ATPase subunit a